MSLVKGQKQVDDHYLIPADKAAEKKKVKLNVKILKNINMIGKIYQTKVKKY